MEYITEDLPVESFPADPSGTDAYRATPFTVVPDLAEVAVELEKPAVNQKEAASAMYQAGLDVEFVEIPSIEREGTILSVNPVAGTRLRQGSLIVIEVSNGVVPSLPDWRGISRFEVPDVVAAFNAELGLNLSWTIEEVAVNSSTLWQIVIGTNPVAGTAPGPNDQIVFFVGVPPPADPGGSAATES